MKIGKKEKEAEEEKVGGQLKLPKEYGLV